MARKVVLMTGCSSGIGLATATRLAHDPAQRYIVIATIISMSEKESLEAAVESVLGKTISIEKMDVTNDEDIATVVDGTFRKYGRIDVLINIAGLTIVGLPERITRKRMEQVFNVNVFGPIRLTQAVLPEMKRRRSGKIVTVSSLTGRIGCPYAEIYGSSKFAAEGYFESLSIALRSFNIRICLVEPSEVSTGLLAQSQRDFASEANDHSIDDIDRRQLASLNKYVRAMPNHTPDVVAKEIATRCLDVDDPVLRHLVIVRGRDEVLEMLSDLTGEKRIWQMVKAISRL